MCIWNLFYFQEKEEEKILDKILQTELPVCIIYDLENHRTFWKKLKSLNHLEYAIVAVFCEEMKPHFEKMFESDEIVKSNLFSVICTKNDKQTEVADCSMARLVS